MTAPASANALRIAGWLGELSRAVANGPDAAGLGKRCVAISLACSDVPFRAWCDATLAEGMRAWKLWPSAAEVRSLLLAWCKDHPEPRPQLTDASRADWSETDWQWFRYWQTRRNAGFPLIEGMHSVPGGDVQAHVASLIRTHSPRAWAAIAGGAA